MDTVRFTADAFRQLADTVGSLPAESGAVIGAKNNQPALISQVWFDEQAKSGAHFYAPSCHEIEKAVGQWQSNGCHFSGIIHSHRKGFPTLSPMDLRSGTLIMEANGLSHILLGLYHQHTLSMFRLSAALGEAHPRLEPLSVTVISAV